MTHDPKVRQLVEVFYSDDPAWQKMTSNEREREMNQTCESVQSLIEDDLAELESYRLRDDKPCESPFVESLKSVGPAKLTAEGIRHESK